MDQTHFFLPSYHTHFDTLKLRGDTKPSEPVQGARPSDRRGRPSPGAPAVLRPIPPTDPLAQAPPQITPLLLTCPAVKLEGGGGPAFRPPHPIEP